MTKLPTPPELTKLPWTHSECQAISNYVYFSDADMLKQHLGIDLGDVVIVAGIIAVGIHVGHTHNINKSKP